MIKTRNSLGKCFSVSINQMRSRVISTWTSIPLDFFQWTENSPPAGQAVSQWLPFLDLEAKNIVIQTYGIYWVQRIFFYLTLVRGDHGLLLCDQIIFSTFYRLGGMIAAYKIVPDEIDEIKVTAIYLMYSFITGYVFFVCLFVLLCCLSG